MTFSGGSRKEGRVGSSPDPQLIAGKFSLLLSSGVLIHLFERYLSYKKRTNKLNKNRTYYSAYKKIILEKKKK